MDLSKYFILLNDEPKTLQIDAIQRNGIKLIYTTEVIKKDFYDD